jgi:hypothetical protein
MPEYQVTWTIEVSAEDPRTAAEEARRLQVKPDTSAVCFEVTERRPGSLTAYIDLQDDA